MKLSISPRLEGLFAQLSAGRSGARLAADILKLSDFFIQHHGARTPWGEKFTLAAYGAYFLPLNVARLRAVWREVERFVPCDSVSEIWDFGSGLGALHWMLEDQEYLPPRPLVCMELESRAVEKHRHLMANFPCRWQPEFNIRRGVRPGTMAVFSFSFLEMQEYLPDLKGFDHLLIVEPSFRGTGRALMQWRGRWIEQGFTPLAPCTHSLACPLLAHSERDWCHQRVHFSGSSRFLELESHLPMKNHTLTFSYLLMSRTMVSPGFRGAVRVIGDTLHEKGKTRQLICRGSEREFLAWLSRHNEPPQIPHGALIRDLGDVEVKSNELRPRSQLSWEN